MKTATTPCLNPALCGVKNHLPNTEAKCRAVKSPTKPKTSASLALQPRLAANIAPPFLEGEELLGEVKGLRPKFEPRKYQKEAAASILKELDKKDRCSARAACGMGKTVIAQHTIAEYLRETGQTTGTFVFLTPSIDLTDQSARAFEEEGILGEHYQRVVHSKSESSKRLKSADADVEELQAFLEAEADRPKVIFCTYQSYRKLQQAQAANAENGDSHQIEMAIMDEAHFLGGEYNYKPASGPKESGDEDEDESNAQGSIPRVFDNSIPRSLQVEKRVFLSATPDFEEEQFVAPEDKPRAKRHGAPKLKEAALNEDKQKPTRKKTRVYFDSPEVFGKTVVNLGMAEALEQKALVPVEVFQANLRTNVTSKQLKVADGSLTTNVDYRGRHSNGGPKSGPSLSLNSWSTAASTLESLASGNGHNALMFLPSVKDVQESTEAWHGIARAMRDHDYTVAEARQKADDASATPSERRSARLTLLAEYSAVQGAWAGSDGNRDAAFNFYNEKDQEGKEQRACKCGKIGGGWCACARIVSNVDLFGQGIDIKAIDTVTIGDISKTSDAKFTQAIGRAMRLKPGKEKGFLVVPSVMDEKGRQLGSRIKTRTLNAVSRMMRDSLGATIAREQMPAEPREAADFKLSYSDKDAQSTPEQVLREESMELKKAAVIDRAYGVLWNHINKVKKESTGTAPLNARTDEPDTDTDEALNSRPTIDEIKKAVQTYGFGLKPGKDVEEAWNYVTNNNVDDVDVENALSRMKVLEFKSRRYDIGSLSDEEILVAKIAGHLDRENLEKIVPKWISQTTTKGPRATKAKVVDMQEARQQRATAGVNYVRGGRLGFSVYSQLEQDPTELYEKYHPTSHQRSTKEASQGATFDDLSTIVPGVAFTWDQGKKTVRGVIEQSPAPDSRGMMRARVKLDGEAPKEIVLTSVSVKNFKVAV